VPSQCASTQYVLTNNRYCADARRRVSGLWVEKSGSIAIVFALMFIVCTSLVGGAIDFGRVLSVKSRLQNALDAASLAATVRLVNDPAHDADSAIATARRHFAVSMAAVPGAALSHSLDPQTQTIALVGTVRLATPFLSVLGIEYVRLEAAAEATGTEGVSGGGSDNEVEIALMLDVTGSMGSSAGDGTTKIKALKRAATNFVDILLPETGKRRGQDCLAPFSANVNLGDTYIQLAPANLGQDRYVNHGVPMQTRRGLPTATCAHYHTNGKNKGQCKKWNDPGCTIQYSTCTATSSSTKYLSRCITERTGDERFTDAEPVGSGLFPATWKTSASSARACTPGDQIVPLTSNKLKLKNTIDEFTANGSTAGHLGTAWAWYMLSPRWSSVFGGEHMPRPYGAEKLKKIAVLMTDGEFNLFYAKNGSGSAVQGDSVAQAKALCDGMKDAGIEVYTVGFKLNNATAIATMKYCASGDDHVFLAEDSVTLDAAFRDVAFRAVPIRLTK